MTLDAATLEGYRTGLRQREVAKAASRAALRARALEDARRAAALLREDFEARRVVVFGSLVEGDGAYFDAVSDIDLAAWGVPEDDYFLAVARLQGLSSEFGMDLVAMERCPTHLRPVIESRGVDL